MLMDGQTGFEHPTPYVPLYGDVKFFGQAHTVYSPSGQKRNPFGAYYWLNLDELRNDTKPVDIFDQK